MSNAVPRSLAALLNGLIDYAGLFPPAGLDMPAAARRYVSYRASPEAWALGRFVVPVARLDELEQMSADPSPGAWRLSVLASLPLEKDVERVARFNDAHASPDGRWHARIDSLELKVVSPPELEKASEALPRDLEVFFEVPADAAGADFCRSARAEQRGLKIRTGGTTIDAFPPSSVVARFLAACAAARVPFKATAGLHHPVRSAHPVTYEPGAPSATMHGFLNLFIAAALLLSQKADVATATRVLEDEIAGAFCFDDQGLAWRDVRLELDEITMARAVARSFGSCSFEEPLAELPR
jgi:hypothetical protein